MCSTLCHSDDFTVTMMKRALSNILKTRLLDIYLKNSRCHGPPIIKDRGAGKIIIMKEEVI